ARTTFLTSVITCSLDECYRRSERHQPKAPILPLRSEHLQGARQAWGSSFGLPDRWPWCGPGDRLFAPGAGAPTGWGDAFDCRSTASVRSEVKPIHRARPVRTRGGCSTLLSVAGPKAVETLVINGVLAVVFTRPAAFGVGLEAAFEIFREIFQPTGVALAFRYGVGRHRLNEVCLLVFPQAGKEVDDTDYNGRPYQPADDSAAKGLFRFLDRK